MENDSNHKPTAKVLFVEDSPENRDFIEDFMKIEAPEIEVRLSTDEENRSLAEFDKKLCVDVIILDFWLDGITGLQILRRIRQSGNPNFDTPVIFLPGNRNDLGDEAARDRLFEEMNVIGIFQKGLVINTIIGRIRDWMRSSEDQ